MIVEDEVAAVAGFTYDAPHRFTEDERHYLQTYAHAAALAIERARFAPLARVASAAQSAGHESPALLIVGEVAALHATLAWYGGAAAAEVSESA